MSTVTAIQKLLQPGSATTQCCGTASVQQIAAPTRGAAQPVLLSWNGIGSGCPAGLDEISR